MTWSFFWRVLSWYILQYCFYDYEFHGRMYNESINCLFEIFPSIEVLWTQCLNGFGHVCTVAFTYRTLYARNSLIHLSLHGRSDVTVIICWSIVGYSLYPRLPFRIVASIGRIILLKQLYMKLLFLHMQIPVYLQLNSMTLTEILWLQKE